MSAVRTHEHHAIGLLNSTYVRCLGLLSLLQTGQHIFLLDSQLYLLGEARGMATKQRNLRLPGSHWVLVRETRQPPAQWRTDSLVKLT